jgi:hypothetical protein
MKDNTIRKGGGTAVMALRAGFYDSSFTMRKRGGELTPPRPLLTHSRTRRRLSPFTPRRPARCRASHCVCAQLVNPLNPLTAHPSPPRRR